MEVTESIRRRIRAYRYRGERIQARINLLAFFRLIVFVVLAVGLMFSFGGNYQYYGAIAALSASAAFLYLMVVHDRCYRFKRKCDVLVDLLEADLARAEFRFKDIGYDDPIRFEVNHPFAYDLDLTGHFSLLKLIDNCFHKRGKQVLADWINRIDPVETIRERQQAVDDLSRRKRLRLRLALAGRLDSVRELDPRDLDTWLKMPTPWTLKLGPYLFGRILSLLTTSSVVLHFFFSIEILPWLPLVVTQAIVFYAFDLVHKRYYFAFMDRGPAIAATCTMVGIFEKIRPTAPMLEELRNRLLVDGNPAGPNLKKVLFLLEMLRYRANGFAHFFLNTLFMWDQHYLRRLDAWRRDYGAHLPAWVDSIFTVEALAALANLRWLYPSRPFPELVPGDDIIIESKNLGHPEIADDQRIGNDYRLCRNGELHLITGSNMSGKSTFLRTIGLNLLLARMGAPVMAETMRCSLPKIWTSIKIQDSLAEGVSYFYAEVRRLKLILDEIKEDDAPVFYLLDELLKGTNSRERLIACRALVEFLIHHKASGLITTHDLELLAVQKQHSDCISNYHFQEQVRDDEMYFDYRLKPGELTSTNALRVLRFARVPLEFDEEQDPRPIR